MNASISIEGLRKAAVVAVVGATLLLTPPCPEAAGATKAYLLVETAVGRTAASLFGQASTTGLWSGGGFSQGAGPWGYPRTPCTAPVETEPEPAPEPAPAPPPKPRCS